MAFLYEELQTEENVQSKENNSEEKKKTKTNGDNYKNTSGGNSQYVENDDE